MMKHRLLRMLSFVRDAVGRVLGSDSGRPELVLSVGRDR